MEAADDDRETPSLGQVFADERERQGLARTEVAQRLHMSAWQIEALEAGDYSRLPQGPFLRGLVRNYAKALGIDAGAMLERLAETAPPGPAPRIVVPSQNIRFDPIGERLSNPYVKAGALAVVFVALGFAGMYWWLFIRPTPAAAKKAVEQPTPQNLAAAPVPPPDPVVVQQAPMELARVDEPKKSSPSATPSSARTLKLRFKGESWVEIRDRSGRILLSRVNPKGSEAEVSGRPPFNVVIGNAPDVQVLYNDREFPLEPHTRVAVARFTVE